MKLTNQAPLTDAEMEGHIRMLWKMKQELGQ